jgi:uncharacterized membrane protein
MNDFSGRKETAHTIDVGDITDVVDIGQAAERDRRLHMLSHILYALYALSWFTGGIAGLVGLVIDYVKRGDAQGTIYATHATWRIRTFWWSLLSFIVALPFTLIYIGYFFFFLIWVWGLYRVIKGWLYLVDKKPLY